MLKPDLKYVWVILLFSLIIIHSEVNAQYFSNGQDPASVKWNQIKTGKFRIIYPQNYAEMAQYYINLFRLTGPEVAGPYLEMQQIKRVPVVLHNRITTSNAMVPLAPIRMEFFEMPSQNIYPQLWSKQLALHEYRHVVQINKMKQGLTKGLYYVFGEQAIAGVMGLWLPFWFIEGDAVFSETLFSHSGRGRKPDFIYPLQAQVLDKKIYKYDKAVFGSFRDFVPDHYTLGYQLVAYGIEHYGIGMWDFTLNRVARRPYYLVPFTTAIKKQTGKFKVQFYNQALKSLQVQWWIADNRSADTLMEIVSPENKFYTSYLFPNPAGDGSVIVEKTSIDDINRVVRITADGKEERLFTPGFDFKESLSVSGSTICWNEKTFDPRWEMQDYSVIKLYDLKTKKVRQLTRKSRYFAPALSHSGKQIATVYVSQQSEYAIHILDASSGVVLKKFSTDDNLFFLTPHWSEDDRDLVAVVLGDKGKSIVRMDAETGKMEYVLPFSFKEIKWPVIHGSWIVYTAAYEGKDNLYAININSHKTFRVLNARFGAVYPKFSKDGKMLWFSDYTADGYRLAKIDFNPLAFQPVSLDGLNYEYVADRLVKPGTFNLDEVTVPDSAYAEKRYRKGGHLFDLHSWGPLSVDLDNYSIFPGATLLSQNILSTSVAVLSYQYDPNEQTNKIKFNYDYMGWYPVISFGVDYGGRRQSFLNDKDEIIKLHWHETNLSLRVSVPLNLTNSKWIKGLQPIIGIDQKFRKMAKGSQYKFRVNRFTVPVYRLFAYNRYKRSRKDIYPKWGQTLDLIYRHTIFSDSASNQLGLTGWFYFPGFVRHQGFQIYTGYQKTVTGDYSFNNLVAVPRGYTDLNYPEYFSILSSYAIPIAYPDWNIPGFFYLKRIYSVLFYDYLRGFDKGEAHNLSSTGVDLYTDWNFLSIPVNVRLGVRGTHRFSDNTQLFNFLFGVTYNY
ncbi:MAG: hypothetical protein GXO86_01050 [Chlorobi bacterium]|nr:hypothetical protein [Chlorobiota bacterium]